MKKLSDKAKGFCFLAAGVLLNLLVSVLTKYLYTSEEYSYNKPYFVSYFGDSLNCIYFGVIYLRKCWLNDKEEAYKTTSSIKTAGLISTALFIQSYGHYGGLSYTSIASSIMITNTSPIFVFFIGLFALDQRFSYKKLSCALISILGFTLIAVSDRESAGSITPYPLLGDFLSLLAAVFSALYTILIKKWIPSHDTHDWMGLFAYMGLTVLICFWPLFFVFHYTGVEQFEIPSMTILLCVLLISLLAVVIGDMLWARSVALMDPLIVDLGLGSVMPLGMITGYVIEGTKYGHLYVVGAVLVMASFVIITLLDEGGDTEEKSLGNYNMELKAILKGS